MILDALSTGQSYAVLDEADTVTGRTDNAGYSITRLIGTEPKNILASVTVEPLDPTTYSSSRPMESNTENSLYATKEETGDFASYYDVESAYLISRNRHLSNIRYNEDYAKSEEEEHKYLLTKDLDFNDAVIYDGLDREVNADFSYYSIQKDVVKLADILGHTSINTTRIYTMETGDIFRRQIQTLGLLQC